jgi:hypothetical protein
MKCNSATTTVYDDISAAGQHDTTDSSQLAEAEAQNNTTNSSRSTSSSISSSSSTVITHDRLTQRMLLISIPSELLLLQRLSHFEDITQTITAHVKSLKTAEQITSTRASRRGKATTRGRDSTTPANTAHLLKSSRFSSDCVDVDFNFAKMKINGDGYCMFDSLSLLYWFRFDKTLCNLKLLQLGWRPEWDAKDMMVKGNLLAVIKSNLDALVGQSKMTEAQLIDVRSYFDREETDASYPEDNLLLFLCELLFIYKTCQVCVLSTIAVGDRFLEEKNYIDLETPYRHISRSGCTTLYMWMVNAGTLEHYEPVITVAELNAIKNQ